MNKRSSKFRIDFAYLLQTINIRLVDALDSTSSAVITAGAEFTVDSAEAP